MFLDSVRKVNLYKLLYLIDKDLAHQQRLLKCPFCHSPLHFSNYQRKPRGGPEDLPEDLLIRHSLCCSSETCRRRVIPPSCRFFGRKVYWHVIILVVLTLKQGRSEGYSFRKLKALFGISRQTLHRWISYFKDVFPVSRRWKKLRGRVSPNISNDQLPAALVLLFIGQAETVEIGWVKLLLFLSGGKAMF